MGPGGSRWEWGGLKTGIEGGGRLASKNAGEGTDGRESCECLLVSHGAPHRLCRFKGVGAGQGGLGKGGMEQERLGIRG